MNWLRTILDGFAMTAYFNLFAAAVALYNPRLMFPCLPVGHYQGCAGTAHKSGEPLLLAVDLFWGAAAPFDLRRSQPGGRRNAGVLADGADRIYPVDDGKPVRPVFSGHLSYPEKGEAPFCHSRYGGHPGYGFKAWMKNYALPEHLLQWPLILCPLMAAVQAGLGLIMNTLRQAG